MKKIKLKECLVCGTMILTTCPKCSLSAKIRNISEYVTESCHTFINKELLSEIKYLNKTIKDYISLYGEDK
jgi:transposase-like protein